MFSALLMVNLKQVVLFFNNRVMIFCKRSKFLYLKNAKKKRSELIFFITARRRRPGYQGERMKFSAKQHLREEAIIAGGSKPFLPDAHLG
ncbi:MAG: hypothetical protein C4531_17480, partial [Desulfurivibrio sp.]